MIITTSVAKNNLNSYVNKNGKISRDVKNKKLFKIVKGLYGTDPNTPAYLLAGYIYGPSYISFEYALSFYGMIPERVTTLTCATFNKKKVKEYNTSFGYFTYRDVPELAYPEDIILIEEGNYSYLIASKEKVLCDKLYSLKPLNSIKNLKSMLIQDLRIDKEKLLELDLNKIKRLSELYHSSNVKLLVKFMEGENNNE